MSEIYAEIPRTLKELLDEETFPEIEIDRGPEHLVPIVEVAISYGSQALGAAASLAAILVAREHIGAFVHKLAFWTAHQEPPPSVAKAAQVTLILTIGSGDTTSRLALDCPIGADGRPAVDIAALIRELTALGGGAEAGS
jgi:hypothetical protein